MKRMITTSKQPSGVPIEKVDLVTYSYPPVKKTWEIRTGIVNNRKLFTTIDICSILGFKKYSQVTSKLPESVRGVVSNDTPGGRQEFSALTLEGVILLAGRSRKPVAKVLVDYFVMVVSPRSQRVGLYSRFGNGDSPGYLGSEYLRARDYLELRGINASVAGFSWSCSRLCRLYDEPPERTHGGNAYLIWILDLAAERYPARRGPLVPPEDSGVMLFDPVQFAPSKQPLLLA